jgi:hypothetical protein
MLTAMAGSGARQKTDLSGIWVGVKETPATLPLAPSAILGARFDIRHTGNTFTLVRPRGAFSVEGTYELGGPEVRLRSPGTGCWAMPTSSRSRPGRGNAMPNGRAPATEFVLTAVTKNSATFENPSHDYPKAIEYTRRADGSLETAISGTAGQRVVTVILKKQ